MGFARSILEHIFRGLIVCTMSPAVCGVLQLWESAFTLWMGITKEKENEKRCFLVKKIKSMCFAVTVI